MAYRWFLPECVKSIPEMLKISAEKHKNSTALIYFGKKINYGTLWDTTERVASLIQMNSFPGERVAIFMPNIPQFVFCYYGALRARRVVVPINFISLAKELRTKPTDQIKITKEISAQLQDSQPALIFVADFLYPILRLVKMNWPHKIVVVSPADFLPFPLNRLYPLRAKREGKYTGPFEESVLRIKSFSEYERCQAAFPEISSVAQLQYTGGTTGIPKGAMLTHANLASNALQAREHLGDILQDGEVALGALPLFHIYGLTVAMNTPLLTLGGAIVLMPIFSPKGAIKAIRKHRITLFPGVNLMYQKIVEQKKLIKKSRMSSLKLCISGAGSIDKTLCRQFEELSGSKIIEGYGLSETSPIISVNLNNGKKPTIAQGSLIGTAVPGTEIKILDDNGQDVFPETPGMITVKGPQVMKGYYQNQKATDEILKDGWLKTGDIGCLDRHNRLYFLDRTKDVIKRRGENIYASNIEKCLSGLASVLETAVIGIPDIKDGEVPIACIVLKTALPPHSNDAKEKSLSIIAYIRSSVMPLEVPSQILFFDSLEEFKNPIGKILKLKLKEEVLKRIT